MMRRLLLAAACGALSGCCWYTHFEHGTLGTTDITKSGAYEVDYTNRVSGADRAHGVWIVPLGFTDMRDAVRKTLDEASTGGRKAVGLCDMTIHYRLLWLYVYSQRWYDVEGYPIYEKK